MKSKTTKELHSFTDISEVAKLFKDMGWEVDGSNKKSLYNRYLSLYNSFTSVEKALFLKLSYGFKTINLKDYQKQVINLLENICKNYCGQQQEVYIMPLKKETDNYRVKSSDFITYLCSSTQIYYIDSICKKKFLMIGDYEFLNKKLNKFNNKPLFLIDDFIGSGKYASDVVDEILKLGINKEKIVVSTLFIHEKGLKRLNDIGIKVEYLNKVDDSLLKTLNKSELEILDKIEEKLNVSEEYHYGYNQSGCMISLIRTPNNSLPVFWFNKSDLAPFPRKIK